jgi:hypothetical protein
MNRSRLARRIYTPGLLAALALVVCFTAAARDASSIIGSVRNQSRGKPAADDDVVLIRLDGRMQEEARAKTDTQGAFTLTVQYPGDPYLVRVIHQGVSYDERAFPGDTLSIQVFDAALHVRGITGTIEILRTATNGNLLHVSDLLEVKNDSNPPLTQAGERTFEVYLPTNAKIDSVLAAGPEKMSVMISAAPIAEEPGHYTVSFPLRPGATKFAFNYDVPYDGHAAFQTKHAYPLQQLAVMIPLTMKFSSPSAAFKILATGNSRYQVQAVNQLKAGEGPTFEVSGTGTLPPLEQQEKSQAQSQASPRVNPPLLAPVGAPLPSLTAIDSRSRETQPSSQSFVLGGMTSVLLAACGLLLWRGRKTRNFSAAHLGAHRVRQRHTPQSDGKAVFHHRP